MTFQGLKRQPLGAAYAVSQIHEVLYLGGTPYDDSLPLTIAPRIPYCVLWCKISKYCPSGLSSILLPSDKVHKKHKELCHIEKSTKKLLSRYESRFGRYGLVIPTKMVDMAKSI